MILLFDTETTGKTEPVRIVQAAWVELASDFSFISAYEEKFNPDRDVDIEALSVHGIRLCDLIGNRPYTDFALPAGVEYMIAHNVDYDWTVAGCPDVKRICTLALSRHVWPNADSHKLLALLYMLDEDAAAAAHKSAHDALADVRINYRILKAILRITEIDTIDELYALSEAARIPTVMSFGKHKGTPISEIPASYRHWLLAQENVDPYLRIALSK